jgi:putative transposase
VKFAFIDAERATWPVQILCFVLGVSCSGFYAWKRRPLSPRAIEDAKLVVDIRAAHKLGRGAYGSPRVHRALRTQGKRVGKKRVERLMQREGTVARSARQAAPETDGPVRLLWATKSRSTLDGLRQGGSHVFSARCAYFGRRSK